MRVNDNRLCSEKLCLDPSIILDPIDFHCLDGSKIISNLSKVLS